MDYGKLLLIALGSYLAGSIPFGYLIGKAKGIDIRTVGSCNIGATNVTRTVGPWYGKLCFLLDFLKGALPVWAAGHFCQTSVTACMLTAAACAVLGHMFTVFLKFKGGKGISTAAGALLVIEPGCVLIALAIWVAVFFAGRYVSLASICAAAALPVTAVCFKLCGKPVDWSIVAVFFFAAVFAIFKHRSNIRRLLEGTESRFERKKKQKDIVQ